MRALKWLLALAVPILLVAADDPAEQQFPDGVTVQLILLRQKSVQEDLKIAPELAKKIIDFTNKEYEAWQQALKLGDAEREQKLKDLQKDNEMFLTDSLTEAQRKRLQQIAMQVTGLHQLTQPEIIKTLSLTEEQQQKIKDLQKDARKELGEIIAAKEREGKNEKLAKLRADIDKKVDAILTDEQKEKAKELTGEPFKGQILLEEPDKDKSDK
jgi:hypothetical protein